MRNSDAPASLAARHLCYRTVVRNRLARLGTTQHRFLRPAPSTLAVRLGASIAAALLCTAASTGADASTANHGDYQSGTATISAMASDDSFGATDDASDSQNLSYVDSSAESFGEPSPNGIHRPLIILSQGTGGTGGTGGSGGFGGAGGGRWFCFGRCLSGRAHRVALGAGPTRTGRAGRTGPAHGGRGGRRAGRRGHRRGGRTRCPYGGDGLGLGV
jgi:hypothetical protein